tara:strand:- start:261 stop:869 length:609 start_codon:yes stop_codon:yes gene_type:complete
MDWSNDIENLLEEIRQNSIHLSNSHKNSYFFYKRTSKYFRLPTIILSSINGVASVGLSAYLDQQHISGLVCLLSVMIGIINSIELFLKVTDNIEREREMSKEFYTLSIDIYKILQLERSNRQISGLNYLEKKYSTYQKLYEQSNLIQNQLNDRLTQLPKKIKNNLFIKKKNSDSSSSSTLSSGSNKVITNELSRYVDEEATL